MRICLATAFPIVAMTTLVGCEGGGGSDCEEILINGVLTCVEPDAGAASLENTRWVLMDDAGNPQVTLVFDDGGNLVELADSALLASLLGASIILDDAPHGTGVVDQLQYSAVAFEAVDDPVSGVRAFTLLTTLEVFFGPVPFLGSIDVAEGTATATGTIEGDIMTGTFIFEIDIDEGVQALAGDFLPPDLPLDSVNESFTFTATRAPGGG